VRWPEGSSFTRISPELATHFHKAGHIRCPEKVPQSRTRAPAPHSNPWQQAPSTVNSPGFRLHSDQDTEKTRPLTPWTC